MRLEGGRVECLGFLRHIDGGLDVFVVALVEQDLGVVGVGGGVVRVKLDGFVDRQLGIVVISQVIQGGGFDGVSHGISSG